MLQETRAVVAPVFNASVIPGLWEPWAWQRARQAFRSAKATVVGENVWEKCCRKKRSATISTMIATEMSTRDTNKKEHCVKSGAAIALLQGVWPAMPTVKICAAMPSKALQAQRSVTAKTTIAMGWSTKTSSAHAIEAPPIPKTRGSVALGLKRVPTVGGGLAWEIAHPKSSCAMG
jgi:hypothetical protein